MVRTKYFWTAPPYGLFGLFVVAGTLSTIPSLLVNAFLSRETELWVFSGEHVHSFLGFFIGAGLGEEFWKMSRGILSNGY